MTMKRQLKSTSGENKEHEVELMHDFISFESITGIVMSVGIVKE